MVKELPEMDGKTFWANPEGYNAPQRTGHSFDALVRWCTRENKFFECEVQNVKDYEDARQKAGVIPYSQAAVAVFIKDGSLVKRD